MCLTSHKEVFRALKLCKLSLLAAQREEKGLHSSFMVSDPDCLKLWCNWFLSAIPEGHLLEQVTQQELIQKETCNEHEMCYVKMTFLHRQRATTAAFSRLCSLVNRWKRPSHWKLCCHELGRKNNHSKLPPCRSRSKCSLHFFLTVRFELAPLYWRNKDFLYFDSNNGVRYPDFITKKQRLTLLDLINLSVISLVS